MPGRGGHRSAASRSGRLAYFSFSFSFSLSFPLGFDSGFGFASAFGFLRRSACGLLRRLCGRADDKTARSAAWPGAPWAEVCTIRSVARAVCRPAPVEPAADLPAPAVVAACMIPWPAQAADSPAAVERRSGDVGRLIGRRGAIGLSGDRLWPALWWRRAADLGDDRAIHDGLRRAGDADGGSRARGDSLLPGDRDLTSRERWPGPRACGDTATATRATGRAAAKSVRETATTAPGTVRFT